MPDTESKYSYLWDGSQTGWVLLAAPELPGNYCIFNKETSVLLKVARADLNLKLCERMRAAGCEVLEEPPHPLPVVRAQRD